MAVARVEAIADVARPFWSVMIPTHRPPLEYLARAVESVTAQLPAGGEVQIEIVDDASPVFDPARFVEDIGVPGVAVHRNARRLGLVGNWNACIRRARGHWVHVLHQDDFVVTGFYAAMRRGIERAPEAGAAFCDVAFVETDGRPHPSRLIRRREAGILEDWLRHVFVQLAIQTPAIVVRREVYEVLGGFDDDFAYAADWDMWKRIAVRYPLWYEPTPLACYRRHSRSETARLRRTGQTLNEIRTSIERSASLLPASRAREVSSAARSAYGVFALENVLDALLRDRDVRAAARQLGAARELSSDASLARALAWITLRAAAWPLRRVRAACTSRI